MAGIELIEGFSWAGTSPLSGQPAANQLVYWLSRYNFAQASGGSSLPPLGRFSGNCLQLGGGIFYQELVLPNGDITTGQITWNLAIESTLWVQGDGALFGIKQSTAHNQFFVGIQGGKLTLQDDVGNVLAVGTTVLQNNAYYSIELQVTIANPGGSAILRLEGVNEIVYSGRTQFAPTNVVHSLILGSPASGPLYRYCDMALRSDLVFMGPIRVVTLFANADGALSQWIPSTGTDQFPLVNQSPPLGDLGYISSSNPGDISLFKYPGLSYNPATIFAVQVSLYCRKDDVSARTVAIEVRSNGSNFVGTTLAPVTTSYLDIYIQIYTTDPGTGLTWTTAGVSGNGGAQYGANLIS